MPKETSTPNAKSQKVDLQYNGPAELADTWQEFVSSSRIETDVANKLNELAFTNITIGDFLRKYAPHATTQYGNVETEALLAMSEEEAIAAKARPSVADPAFLKLKKSLEGAMLISSECSKTEGIDRDLNNALVQGLAEKWLPIRKDAGIQPKKYRSPEEKIRREQLLQTPQGALLNGLLLMGVNQIMVARVSKTLRDVIDAKTYLTIGREELRGYLYNFAHRRITMASFHYDPDSHRNENGRIASFRTYAEGALVNRRTKSDRLLQILRNEMEKLNRSSHMPLSEEITIAPSQLDDATYHTAILDTVAQLTSGLSKIERFVFDRNVLTSHPETLQILGDKFGVTKQAMAQARARAMKKIGKIVQESGLTHPDTGLSQPHSGGKSWEDQVRNNERRRIKPKERDN